MLTRLIDGLRPYLKAVAPAVLGILGLFITAIDHGQLDRASLEVALIGFIAASVTFAVSNAPHGWQRYAKAIVPAALTVVAVVVHWLVTGEWSDAEWRLAVNGLGAAVISYLIPNGSLFEIAHVEDPDIPRDPKISGMIGFVSDSEEFASPPPQPDGGHHVEDITPFGTDSVPRPEAGRVPAPPTEG
jgi:hypothetical protein